ncbi:MAG: efflux RND transporter periplasmic adaptor subunit [Desulfamplus sp.]|nr:efflux RND transporter periplasmic adaptor subunit [Desulfamplus sp.]
MKKRLPIIVLFIIIVVVGITLYPRLHLKKESGKLTVSGTIEVTEINLSFRIPGVLSERFVDEGDSVKKGQTVAKIENKDQEIALSKAQATLDNATALLAELEAGSRTEEIESSYARLLQATYYLSNLRKGSRSQEIESAKAELDSAVSASKTASAQLNQAKADFNRYETLYRKNGVSQRDYEHYKTQYETARNKVLETDARIKANRQTLSLKVEGTREDEIKKAEASLKQAQAEYELVKTGPRKERLDQAKAQVKIALESLNQAKQQLIYTEIKSPIDGVVLSKSAEAGEYLNPASPVVSIGDIRHPWLRAYINELDLGKIKLKDKMVISTDAFGDKEFNGIIKFISSEAEFTPKVVQTFEERVKLMYRIKIDVDNPELLLKPGMPADAHLVP